MIEFEIEYFTKDKLFPFFIQYGRHEEDLIMHSHKDFSELVIVLSGRAIHLVDDESFFVKTGDIFVISNYTTHGYNNPKNFRICNIMFSHHEYLSENNDLLKIAGFHALFIIEPYYSKNQQFTSHLSLSQDNFYQIKNLLDLMLQEYQTNNEGKKTALVSCFIYLVTLLSRFYGELQQSISTNIFALASSVAYIENHFTEDISIKELVKLSGYSTRHFNRLFHEAYSTSPLDYVLSLRIEYACSLLVSTNETISSIGLLCGFNTPNYFYRIFKDRMKVSPNRYRMKR